MQRPEAGANLEHWRKQKKARMAETHGPRASVGRTVFSGQSLVFGVYSDGNENYCVIFCPFFFFELLDDFKQRSSAI